MVYPVCAARSALKEIIAEKITVKPHGDFIKDDEIHDWVKDAGAEDLTYNQVMACIRQMEEYIGLKLKKRLKRIRNEGYLILEPRVQADTALREGKEKVQAALKKTSKRLDAVDVSSFTPEQQREMIKRTSAIDSFLAIVTNSSVTKKIMNRQEIEILNNTAIGLRRTSNKNQ